MKPKSLRLVVAAYVANKVQIAIRNISVGNSERADATMSKSHKSKRNAQALLGRNGKVKAAYNVECLKKASLVHNAR